MALGEGSSGRAEDIAVTLVVSLFGLRLAYGVYQAVQRAEDVGQRYVDEQLTEQQKHMTVEQRRFSREAERILTLMKK